MANKISRKIAPQCHHSVLVLLRLVLCGICSKSQRSYIQIHFPRIYNPALIFQIRRYNYFFLREVKKLGVEVASVSLWLGTERI